MCDPTWTVAQSIRFVISKLCRYAVRQDGSVRVYSAPVTARAEQIAKMRYGADARCDGQTADGMEYPAIAGTIGLSRIGAQGYVLTLAKIARRTTITMPAFERLARTGAPFYRSREDERDAQAIRGEHLAQSDVARFIREILSPATPYTPATKNASSGGLEKRTCDRAAARAARRGGARAGG
ncbi:hypothetical protein [Paraburkholderia youngii]|uniref:hypothetical protein n=1 Tax=Paraburkholderia youngii TaxID=2782701 RepID=UPI003D1FF7F0